MAVGNCEWCNQDKEDKKTVTCIGDGTIVEFPDGEMLRASTEHGNELDGRCHDCNVEHGGYHHPGCDMERCPRCGRQIVTCDCFARCDGVGEECEECDKYEDCQLRV